MKDNHSFQRLTAYEWGIAKDGVEYVIMDAQSMTMGMAMQDKLVAIFEDGKWYYVRPNGKQAQVLQELYGIEVE